MAKKIIFLILLSKTVLAFNLQTDEIKLQLPEPWACTPEKQLWICEEKMKARQKPALIIIQAKKAQPKETYVFFRDQLKNPRSIKGKKGPLLSRVVSMQDRVINGQQWFEAIHHEGELDGYYTQYLATRRGDYAFLITMSAHKSKWDSYKVVFQNVVATITPLVSSTASTPVTNVTNVAPAASNVAVAAPTKAPSFLNKKLNLPIPGITVFHAVAFAIVTIFGLAILYSLRR